MLERYLIEHCSPTLAALKTANLFTYSFSAKEDLDYQIAAWNRQLSDKGITLLALRYTACTALVYVCRKERLQQDLSKPEIKKFLEKYGYIQMDVEYAIARLKSRLEAEAEFPHEIGIFLGYPLGDVVGFVENAGKNSKCTGCWKVYCNECEAIKVFARFDKCKAVYMRLWNQGRSVRQLTVA